MKLNLKRIKTTTQSTIGELYINNEFTCYTLEDTFNKPKKYGETRIPAGTYKLRLNTTGAMNEKYKNLKGVKHIGMIELLEVPGFSSIYIHIGNTDDDTKGCILVGMYYKENIIIDSTKAYIKVYNEVSLELSKGNSVEITIE